MADRAGSLWHNRNFLLLWSGQLISSIGTGVSQLAFPLLTLALSGSPAQAGLVAALNQAPYFLLSLPAGVLVDRWDRKRVMLVCEAGRALSLLSLPLVFALGHPSVLLLGVVSLLNGIFFVFFDLAGASCLPRLVEPIQLATATSLSMTTEGVTNLLGAPLGGLLYSMGRALPFVADALSYVVSACSLLLIKASFQQERVEAPFSLLRACARPEAACSASPHWRDLCAGRRRLRSWRSPGRPPAALAAPGSHQSRGVLALRAAVAAPGRGTESGAACSSPDGTVAASAHSWRGPGQLPACSGPRLPPGTSDQHLSSDRPQFRTGGFSAYRSAHRTSRSRPHDPARRRRLAYPGPGDDAQSPHP